MAGAGMDARLLVEQLRGHDEPEVRSQAAEQLALADKRDYDRDVVLSLVEALDDKDPVVQEWATVALRKCRGEPRAISALWDCFESEGRESVRCCALSALGRLGEYLPPRRLRTLYQDRRERPEDLLLTFAIYWAGRNSADPGMLEVLHEIEGVERRRVPHPSPVIEAALNAALLRCARECLARNAITKGWLKKRGCDELLKKLSETRIERLIAAKRAELAQPSLLPGLDAEGPDTPLVPGRALVDVQEEQYIQDLAEWKNVRVVQERSYIRDQTLARQVKKTAGYTCQVCYDSLGNAVVSRQFVHAHHLEPLAESGPDTGENLVVLCPSCHARLHAREIKVERRDDGLYATVGDSESRPLSRESQMPSGSDWRDQALYQQVLHLFEGLTRERQTELLNVLIEKGTAGRLDRPQTE